MLHPFAPYFLPCSFLIPIPVFVRHVFMGVCSEWAVGGVVIMESVLCYLWAGLQNTHQEVHG